MIMMEVRQEGGQSSVSVISFTVLGYGTEKDKPQVMTIYIKHSIQNMLLFEISNFSVLCNVCNKAQSI